MNSMRKLVVLVVGVALLVIGAAMIVLPGPALVVLPLGLAVLGAEFPWARRLLRFILERFRAFFNRLTQPVAPPE